MCWPAGLSWAVCSCTEAFELTKLAEQTKQKDAVVAKHALRLLTSGRGWVPTTNILTEENQTKVDLPLCKWQRDSMASPNNGPSRRCLFWRGPKPGDFPLQELQLEIEQQQSVRTQAPSELEPNQFLCCPNLFWEN